MSQDAARIVEKILVRSRTGLSRVGLVTLAALVLAGMIDALVAPAPVPSSPGFVGTILASHGVVAAIRVAIIFGAAYLVLSVVVLARRGRWLTKVGPAEAGEAIHTFDVKQEIDTELAEATAQIHRLRKRLEAAEVLQDTLVAEIRSRGSHDPHR